MIGQYILHGMFIIEKTISVLCSPTRLISQQRASDFFRQFVLRLSVFQHICIYRYHQTKFVQNDNNFRIFPF